MNLSLRGDVEQTILKNDIDVFKQLISIPGAYFDPTNFKSVWLLTMAMDHHNLDLAECMLDFDSSLVYSTWATSKPMVFTERLDQVKLLIRYGADYEGFIGQGEITALSHAISSGREEIVEFLVREAGVSIDENAKYQLEKLADSFVKSRIKEIITRAEILI